MSENVIIDLQSYLATHGELKRAIEGLNEDQLKWKASPEVWSVTEVLSHLADHNFVVTFRIREILSGTTSRLPAFSQDDWVRSTRANESDANDILDLYEALLAYNELLFRRLRAEDWHKTAVNAKGDTVSLADAVRGFIAHVHVHLKQIGRIKLAYELV
ncbi:DinB family protein [Paenibacillus beijingensis]|uniref:DinB-like domain-containing protein n=1 Tax=Paenibacillus beijingensis TaxID=1126833 RepID=A0A0D5NFC3_9BACL|nr:DinB family protein [Paenibacillus beijingensis]AJY73657.1 hypothetical protein VN24_02205 [Paenibacillus beijingensis]